MFGFDPAGRKDGSALLVLDATESPRRVVYLEDLRGRSYPEQVARVAQLAAAYRPTRVALDATGLGDVVLDLLRDAGVPVDPIRFTASVKADLVQSIAVALERRELVLPPHAGLIEELRQLRVERTPAGHDRYEAPPGANDDRVFALALALRAAGPVLSRSFAHTGALPFLMGDEPQRRYSPVSTDPIEAWFAWADGSGT